MGLKTNAQTCGGSGVCPPRRPRRVSSTHRLNKEILTLDHTTTMEE